MLHRDPGRHRKGSSCLYLLRMGNSTRAGGSLHCHIQLSANLDRHLICQSAIATWAAGACCAVRWQDCQRWGWAAHTVGPATQSGASTGMDPKRLAAFQRCGTTHLRGGYNCSRQCCSEGGPREGGSSTCIGRRRIGMCGQRRATILVLLKPISLAGCKSPPKRMMSVNGMNTQ